MTFRENQLISIVLDGQMRRGRIRSCDHTSRLDSLYLYVGGRARGLTPDRIDLSQLTPETEGISWARGWNTQDAKALETAQALAPTEPPALGEAGKKLIRALTNTIAAKPKTVKAAIGTFAHNFLAQSVFNQITQPKPSKP